MRQPEQYEAVLSTDRLNTTTMIVAFCDLKGSTKVLRELGPENFRELQSEFFQASNKIISAANFAAYQQKHKDIKKEADIQAEFNQLLGKEEKLTEASGNSAFEAQFPTPWARVDKFMGDCTMFYIQCGAMSISKSKHDDKAAVGKSNVSESAALHQAARTAMRIVSSLIEEISSIEKKLKLDAHAIKLGSRVGIALGEGICLSWLGEHNKPGYSYTVTGETVNLAARLEHATKAEFLSCINEEKASVNAYTQHLTDLSHLHGTALGQALVEADRHLIELYTVCDRRFQIRANDDFIHFLENGPLSVKLRWRRIPFSPQGFDGKQIACLLGGDTASDLFRTV